MKLREHLASLPFYERWLILGTILGIIIGLSIITLVKIIEILSLVFIKPFGLTYLQIIRGKIKIPLILFFPLIAGLGGLLTGIIATKLAPETLGAGTDYAIEVFHFREGRIRWRVWFLKIITSSLTLGSGASAGDEGPSALIGAGIGSFLANLLGLNKEDRRIAVAVGIGAGIGSVFKAPIGGAVLSAEVLYKKDIEPEVIYPAIITSAVSYSIVGLILGYSPIFGYYTYTFSPLRLPLYAILGFLAGLIAILYVKTYRKVRETFVELKAPNILKPALGGLISGLLAIIFPEIISSGYAWDKAFELGLINEIPTYGLPLLLILVLLPFIKIIATSFSVGSGESGGLFAPSLMIGGSLGLLIGLLFHHLFPSLAPYVAPFVLIGMLSVLSASGKLPLSVIIMIVEMTGSLQLVPGELIATAIAYIVSGNYSLFDAQVTSRRDSPAHISEFLQPILSALRVHVCNLKSIYVNINSSINETLELMNKYNMNSLPVVNNNEYMGIINFHDVYNKPKDEKINKYTILTRRSVLRLNSSLGDALELMGKLRTNWAPVIDENDNFIGILTLDEISRVYRNTLQERY